MNMHQSGSHSNSLMVVIVICVTLVLLAGVGGWVYTQQQSLAQEKVLHAERLKAEKEQAQIQADAEVDAARKLCNATSSSVLKCF